MSLTICLSGDTIAAPQIAGHLWVYLNWALSARALGCRVVWLEEMNMSGPERHASIARHKARLEPFGLADGLALYGTEDGGGPSDGCLDLDAAAEADLLLNLRYDTPPDVVKRFRRSALLDIDPGLLQLWMAANAIPVAPHDLYFTTGETVGRRKGTIPDVGLEWHDIPPCVALDWWPACAASSGAAFTTITHWSEDAWVGDADHGYRNDKRSGFLPFLDLPRRTSQPLELAVHLGASESEEEAMLERHGWRVRSAASVASTLESYQRYIQGSRGEFACAKPAYVRLQSGWVSDRTLCYLASGKPAVVQHTGPSRLLPDAAGLFRFRSIDDAARSLETVAADYERQCRLARGLAEAHFDGRKVMRHLLERAL